MLAAVEASLPAEIAVCAAAVGDWRVAHAAEQKIKKSADGPPSLRLTENPDILAHIAAPGPSRPKLVIGFAAETEQLFDHASAKLARKNCDWIIANNVGGTGIMGGAENEITLITATGAELFPRMDKTELARQLAARIAKEFS
jgi:phosphopantothenoylcysteine decarboxylase/phosphopantothenate--cysteine ligase